MKLPSAFYRLPLRFEVQRLIDEVSQFAESEWRVHPQGHAGNSALPLLAVDGDPTNDATHGPMQPTPHLARCPYLRQVLAALDAPIGRTRLMRIAGHGEATAHVDTNYYWSQRVRVHIPVLTYPGVRFLCGDEEVFMDGGECWIFDTWRNHNVLNPDDRPRIHLVADTVGSESFWGLVDQADRPSEGHASGAPLRIVPFAPGAEPELATELHNFPTVMSPWEVQFLVDQIWADLAEPADAAAPPLRAELDRFVQRWRALWARYGDSAAGRPAFRAELRRLAEAAAPHAGRLRLTNRTDPVVAVEHWISRAAVAPDRPAAPAPTPPARAAEPSPPPRAPAPPAEPRFDRPVFIVAAPRSGSTLLFETLARAADCFTIGGESHRLIEGIAELTPAAHGYESNRLTAADATAEVIARLHDAFWGQLRDRDGRGPAQGGAVRLLEKTPKNALRIPFLAAAFPDARFIYLYREPAESMASIIEAWKSGRFVTYPRLPGWEGPWSLLLTPGWRELRGRSPAEIAASQWEVTNRQIMDDLAALPADRWCAVSYQQLLTDPQATAERLCRFADLRWDQQLGGQLPLARHTLTPPDPQKWRAHAAAVEPLLPALEPIRQRAMAAMPAADSVRAPGAASTAGETPAPGAASTAGATPGAAPLRSIHTASVPQLLRELGISVLASTYQAGRLAILRADSELLNTHFVGFNKPMGLALRGSRLAIATDIEIREFVNVPAHARRLTPPDRHDACFLPRSVHTTGDTQTHELAWAGDELWFVNTRFSCVCTLDPAYSFVPRWRPPFISALAPEDRCHLNGMELVDGRLRYVTALGETDTPAGWRDRKRDGGVLIDVASGEIITRGLSMPHSPRWYAGKLWVLNSGAGGVGVVDLADGRYQEVARLPGFTRGIDFHGRYAFIGLSQVRESAVFSGIAIAEVPVEERACGIWVLDIVSGQTVGFVRFMDALQEIFAVQVAGLRFPELVTDDRAIVASAFVLPSDALAEVPAELVREHGR